MVEGEKAILSISPNAAILRISLPMGPSFSGHAGAIDWITSRFKNHKPATLYFDEFRSPTYVEDMNDVFEQFLSESYSGLYHFGGPKNLSLYQIGQIINKAGVTILIFYKDASGMKLVLFLPVREMLR